MRLPFILFFIFIFTHTLNAQSPEIQRFVQRDLHKDGLQGPVKQVDWYCQDSAIKPGEDWIWGEHRLWRTCEYDQQGLRVKEIYENTAWLNKFDAEGRLLQTTILNPKNEPTGHFRILYDNKGHRLEEQSLDANRQIQKIWKYNWMPRIQADYLDVMNPDGSLRGQGIWRYDQQGNDTYRGGPVDGEIAFVESFREYDEQGNEICFEQRQQKRDGGFSLLIRRGPNEHEPLEKIIINEDGVSKSILQYEYDEHGNWIEQEEIPIFPLYHAGVHRPIAKNSRTILYYE